MPTFKKFRSNTIFRLQSVFPLHAFFHYPQAFYQNLKLLGAAMGAAITPV